MGPDALVKPPEETEKSYLKDKAELFPAKKKENLVDAYKWMLYETPLSFGTLVYQSVAKETYGNFKHVTNSGKPVGDKKTKKI